MYAIIDIETTGLSAKNEKITEIAIILHDGKKVTNRFESLVNPDRKIPYRITQITGINDQMVASAPKFYEIAKKIIELTEGRTIIGHNVTFDYNFIKEEFKEFNYNYQRKTLCTVKMSRKVFPGLPSYSLGKLTKALKIEHGIKHRAMGDAEATKDLFELILENKPDIANGNVVRLPKALSQEKIDSLPNEAGVYYFLDAHNNIIYVGKSKHIKQRIQSHLNNYSTKKAVEMIDNIADIQYVLTGSELIALLFESDEIKRLKPLYNRAQIRSVFHYGIFLNISPEGYFHLSVGKNEALSKPLTSFSSAREAKDFLHNLAEDYLLCHKYCDLHTGEGPCFSHQIHQCEGACIGKESPESYNEKVQKATERMHFRTKDFFLLVEGRNSKELGVVQVKSGSYKGYGYMKKVKQLSIDKLKDCIEPKNSNKDSNNIVLSWIRNHSCEMILDK